MKLDIGRGKILGTKTVSSNGQISGFTEYAGREVLVVLPDEDTEVQADPREVVEEIKLATQQHMKVAFREYEQLKQRFQGPGEATRQFLDANAPRSFSGLYETIERWVGEQASDAEDRVRRALGDDETPSESDPQATNEVSP